MDPAAAVDREPAGIERPIVDRTRCDPITRIEPFAGLLALRPRLAPAWPRAAGARAGSASCRAVMSQGDGASARGAALRRGSDACCLPRSGSGRRRGPGSCRTAGCPVGRRRSDVPGGTADVRPRARAGYRRSEGGEAWLILVHLRRTHSVGVPVADGVPHPAKGPPGTHAITPPRVG